jgi:hypothetical protein
MKKFLLIAGYNYYPCAATEDWIGCFSSREEAESQIIVVQEDLLGRISINGSRRDWYEIIDLEEWMNE